MDTQVDTLVGGELVHVAALVPEPPEPPARAEASCWETERRWVGGLMLILLVWKEGKTRH
jgi:uncharacterized membrane protein